MKNLKALAEFKEQHTWAAGVNFRRLPGPAKSAYFIGICPMITIGPPATFSQGVVLWIRNGTIIERITL